MKAIGILGPRSTDDPECFIESEVQKPVAEGRELLVRIRAISVNPVDVKRRLGKADDGRFAILGWDVSGTVEETGPECSIFHPGDDVFYSGSVTRTGSASEYGLVDERIAGRKPSTLTHEEAAALPLTSITAWEAMFDRMKIPTDPESNRGKSILIIGSAGGVGSIASQLASNSGLEVFGTASRPESAKWATDHGVSHVIDRKKDFGEQLNSFGREYVDYVLCLNSLDEHWNTIIDCIAPLGRICSIVSSRSKLDLMPLWSKSASFSWEFMSTRPDYVTSDMIYQHDILNHLADMVDEGKIRTTLTTLLSPLNVENMRIAHAQLEKGDTIGKIVIEL